MLSPKGTLMEQVQLFVYSSIAPIIKKDSYSSILPRFYLILRGMNITLLF